MTASRDVSNHGRDRKVSVFFSPMREMPMIETVLFIL